MLVTNLRNEKIKKFHQESPGVLPAQSKPEPMEGSGKATVKTRGWNENWGVDRPPPLGG